MGIFGRQKHDIGEVVRCVSLHTGVNYDIELKGVHPRKVFFGLGTAYFYDGHAVRRASLEGEEYLSGVPFKLSFIPQSDLDKRRLTCFNPSD